MKRKIVFVGDSMTPEAVKHIHDLANDEVYVAEINFGPQLVRRIIDADEIHLFHVNRDDEFELGMIYFFSVHALHYRLGWKIKVFGEIDSEYKTMFDVTKLPLEAGERLVTDLDPILLPVNDGN